MEELTRVNGSNCSLPGNFSSMSNATCNGTMTREPLELNVLYATFEILVAICAVVGNALTILVFRRERRLRRRTNYYIVSLSCADLLVGGLGIPFAIMASVGLPRNLHACLFTVSLLVVLCTISIFSLVAVSVDRYWAILHPMGYSRNVRTKTAIGIIAACWVAGAIIGFLPLFGWHSRNNEDPFDDERCLFTEVMDYNYLVFLYLATIIIPGVIIGAFYAHIYQVVLKQLRQIVTMNPMPAGATSTRSVGGTGTMLRMLGAAQKREVKATQNLSVIVAFFIVCWFPLYTINCFQAFCRSCSVPSTVTSCCIILSHLNSAGNPLLYAYHLRDFRAALKNLFYDMFGKGDSQNINGQFLRPSVGSQNIQQQHVVNNSRNNSMQSMQNVGRIGLPGQHVYTDSPKVRLSRMILPTTSTIIANNLSNTSVTSGLTTVHEAAVCVPMYVNRQPPNCSEPSKRLWTVGDVPPIPEGESSQKQSADLIPDCPSLRSIPGRKKFREDDNGQVNSAYIEDGANHDNDDIISYIDDVDNPKMSDDDDDEVVMSTHNPGVISALNELPFSYRSSGNLCEGNLNLSSVSPPTPRKVSSSEKQTLANEADHGFSSDSSTGPVLLVEAEINVCEEDHEQLSPRNSKISIIGNGNGELKRGDLSDDNKPANVVSRRMSPLKAVSDFLLGTGVNKGHRVKDVEPGVYQASMADEETNNSPRSGQLYNGEAVQMSDKTSGLT